MKVIPWLSNDPEYHAGGIATIGVFDGVHIGHQALLKGVVDRARAASVPAVVVTFDPHPQTVVGTRSDSIRLLTSMDERFELFAKHGIDYAIVCNFNRDFSLLTAEQFLTQLQKRYSLSALLLGPTHKFGYKMSGNRETLPALSEQFQLPIDWIEPTLFEGTTVSTSLLRKLLLAGKVKDVATMLGRPYHLTGHVVTGEQRGRKLGVPTANVQVEPENRLIPADGVYLASTSWDNGSLYPTLLSIGTRPTFGDLPRAVEAHILDFTGDLYGRRLSVNIIEYMRPQYTFANATELKDCMAKDDRAARDYFAAQSQSV